MTARPWLFALPFAALAALGASSCPSGGPYVRTEYLALPGYVEPHTPGSGDALEMAATASVQAIVGGSPDLNQVSYLRSFVDQRSPPAPRTIAILLPGFLGGAGTFTPLAEQLVAKFNGGLEVWSVDRRPNQLEDRRGSEWAQERIAAATTAAEIDLAIEQGLFFYVPESPGLDSNENGVQDPPFELPDALGASRPYVRLAQDDMRFAAHWGVDTYVRDWKVLVDAARAQVGQRGVVLLGGHSQGTYWASVFAAYDFDPDPAVVDAGHSHLDGILLLEGGGGRAPTTTTPGLASYQTTVANLAAPGGPDVFLASFQGIEPSLLGPTAEIAGLAGVYQPFQRSLVQRTTVFLSGPFALFFNAPADSRTLVGLFIDDDFQPVTAFRAGVGFSANGNNVYVAPAPPLFGDEFYIASNNGALRTWIDSGDPAIPTCPPNVENPPTPPGGVGCGITDNGPRPAPTDPPRLWGVEVEPTRLLDLLEIQYAASNFVEWYFLTGRTGLDGAYGIDSSALVAESVATSGDEGPLVLTQQAAIDVPVLCIGGSNGLAPLESSFAPYLASIATPAADKQVAILEGYAHLDVLTAADNAAVPLVSDWIARLQVRKLLAP
jgi:pimeloyl-ACP methyl ester carboxylesterase